jgi:hypothetical protein
MAEPRSADGDTFLIVNGAVRKDGPGVIHDSFQTAISGGLSAHQPNGSHCLQFHGAAGPLTRHCFSPSFETGDGPADLDAFSRVIPLPEGATRLALVRGDAELASVGSGATRPTAALVSPTAGSRLSGSVRVAWSGSDPSGGPLFYALQYSNDGGRGWRALPVAAGSTQSNVDAGQLVGPRVHFRVLASNGLYSSGAVSGPFDIVQNPRLDPPPAAIEFGNLQAGGVRQVTVGLTNSGSSVLELRSVTSDNPEFELSTGSSFLAGGRSESLAVVFAPRQAGAKQARLIIETNDPSTPRHVINLTGAASAGPVANITVLPTLLDFATVTVGQTKDLDITIGNSGNAELNVASLAFSSAVFSAVTPVGPFSVAPGAEARVSVRFRPAAAGVVSAMLTINSDDPTRAALRIPLTGSGSGGATVGPRIEVAPTALTFGDVTVGQNRELDVVARNTGNAPLAVSGIGSSNPRFTLVAPTVPFTVAAGGQQAIRARFSPAAAGPQTGDLAITSNDPSRATVTVPLSGTGIAGPAAPPANFGGQWTTTSSGVSYALTITQNGASVTGTYPHYTGTITGTVNGNVLTGSWTDVSGTGTFTLTLSADGTRFAGTWVRTSAPGGAGTWDGIRAIQPGQTEILSIDDGTFESVVGFPQGGLTGFFVNRLTPSRYPATLRAVRIYFPSGQLPVGTEITVVSAAHPSGSSASPIAGAAFQSTSARITATREFVEYAVAPITITSGDFLVGFSADNPATIFPASLDRTPPARQRSYIGTTAASIRFLAEANDGNLAIRARVD